MLLVAGEANEPSTLISSPVAVSDRVCANCLRFIMGSLALIPIGFGLFFAAEHFGGKIDILKSVFDRRLDF